MAIEFPDNLEERRICWSCVGEIYLREQIKKGGDVATCAYCHGRRRAFTLSDLAEAVEHALEEHYYRTPSEPDGLEYLAAKEGRGWERHGSPVSEVIASMAEIDDGAAEHIREILSERTYDIDAARAGEENPFDEEAYYEEGPVHDHERQAQWAYFQRSLQFESRFFNREARTTLEDIFSGLTDHEAHDGRPVIVEAGPGTPLPALFRARVFQSSGELKQALKRPDHELGPPPPKSARAGRMNAQGVAVFYGATNAGTALAEVRPPVGSKVLLGRFEIVRTVQLLDIEALSGLRVVGSVFDPKLLPALRKAKFLRFLSQRISLPVMPDDEPFEYLVTQAIADYLAESSEPRLDGIIYSSVQSGAERNVVLFHKAARVAELDIPVGTEIDARLETISDDGPEPDYWVWEEVPEVAETAEPGADTGDPFAAWRAPPDTIHDAREECLRLVVDSLTIQHIEAVSFQTDEFPVRRHRSEKRTPDF
jgi:RES domain-containing protein